MGSTMAGRGQRFTIWHGLAVSVVLHAALGLPLVAQTLIPPDDEAPVLVLDLQGFVADEQVEQQVLEQKKGERQQEQTEVAKPQQAAVPEPEPPEPPPPQAEEPLQQDAPSPREPQSPPQQQKAADTPGTKDIVGAEQQQQAQTIRTQRQEIDDLSAYVKLLTRKVQANLIYPERGRREGLQGTATVAFAIRADGSLRAETLKIVESSGKPLLDASALQTIKASAPFAPPPRAMTVAVAVAFSKRP